MIDPSALTLLKPITRSESDKDSVRKDRVQIGNSIGQETANAE